ncbi:MAG: MATE family efflux transporter [Rhodospirillales bacterium]
MKDLTQGPIFRHLFAMAAPIAIGMLLQVMYYLVDLYFVAKLGGPALAGVSAAGNVWFVVFALTQIVGVGTVALMSHAVGRKDQTDANHVFNQSVLLSVICAAVTLIGGYGLTGAFMRTLGADAATNAEGIVYLYWFIPGLGLQFALVVMGSALRGTGIVKPTMVVQMLTILLNIVLAPVLIAGWGTGYAMGVAGAGLASSLSIAVGVLLMSVYFFRLEHYVGFDTSQWLPKPATWGRILNIGLPAGGEFFLMFLYNTMLYWIIRDFGASAQAGFGIGGRVMQGAFMPVMAIALAAAPIGGQNFGAKNAGRVRETFRDAVIACSAIMFVFTLVCQWRGEFFIRFFSSDPQIVAVGAEFLHFISWNFVAMGIVFTCSSMFQALGNTWPSLMSTGLRVVTFAGPAVWLSLQPGFKLVEVWYLSVASVALQAVVSLLLLRWQMRKRLQFAA